MAALAAATAAAAAADIIMLESQKELDEVTGKQLNRTNKIYYVFDWLQMILNHLYFKQRLYLFELQFLYNLIEV